jgi:hypothetical protein
MAELTLGTRAFINTSDFKDLDRLQRDFCLVRIVRI